MTNFSSNHRWDWFDKSYLFQDMVVCIIDNNKLLTNTISYERLQATSSKTNILVKLWRELIWQELALSRIMLQSQSDSGLDNYMYKYKLFTISNERLQASSLTTTYSKLSIKHPVLLNDQVHLIENRSYCFISRLPRPIFGLY